MKLLAFAVLILAAVLAVHLADRPPAAVAAPMLQGGVGPGTGPNGMLTMKDVPLSRTFSTRVPSTYFQPSSTSIGTGASFDLQLPLDKALLITSCERNEQPYTVDILIDGAPAGRQFHVDERGVIFAPPGALVTFLSVTGVPAPFSVQITGALLDAAWL